MITLCNQTFKDVVYVKRAYNGLRRRHDEKNNLSDYEKHLLSTMYKWLNDYAYNNISGRE